jgi:hypothetical protein
MIAGNAGKPLGYLNKSGKITNLKKSYNTQEENIIQWIIKCNSHKGQNLFTNVLKNGNDTSIGFFGLEYDQITYNTVQSFDYKSETTTEPYKVVCTMQITDDKDYFMFGICSNANQNM